MSSVIVKMRFLECSNSSPNNSKYKGNITRFSVFGKSGLFEYTSRESANLKRIDEELELRDNSFFSYTSREGANKDYDDNEENKIIFTNYGLLNGENKNLFKEECSKYFTKKGDLLWDLVISFDNYEEAKQMGLNNIKDYGSLVSKVLPDFFKKIDIKNENILWWTNYHTNTDHPHLHLCFLEKNKTRTRGKITDSQLDYFKYLIKKEALNRKLNNSFLKDTYQNLLKKKNESKDILLDKVKGMDLRLFKKVQDLFLKLPEKGRLQYNSIHIKPYREEIDEIVKEIIENDFIKESYQNFINKIDELNELSQEAGNDFNYKIKDVEVRKVHINIANYLLSCKKYFKYSNNLLVNENNNVEINLSSKNNSEGNQDIFINTDKFYSNQNDFQFSKQLKNFIGSSITDFLNSNTTFKHNLFNKAKGGIGKNTKEIEEEIEKYLNMSRGQNHEYN